MKAKKNELDVDFIGGAGPLTKDEEKRVSDIIKSHKAKQTARRPKRKLTAKKRVIA